jgi:hypothetical protein
MKKIFGAALLAACLGFVGCEPVGPAGTDSTTPDAAVPGDTAMPGDMTEETTPAEETAPIDEAAPQEETLPE